jgi:hypothetical protein
LGSVVDFPGERFCRVGERFEYAEKASICAVKSRRRLVVSPALACSVRDARGVGDGVRSARRMVERTVDGVVRARARGVAYCCQQIHLANVKNYLPDPWTPL